MEREKKLVLEVESKKLLILGPFELYPEFESLGIEGKET